MPAAVAESDSEEEGESVDEVSVGLNSSRHDQLQHQYVTPAKRRDNKKKRPPDN